MILQEKEGVVWLVWIKTKEREAMRKSNSGYAANHVAHV